MDNLIYEIVEEILKFREKIKKNREKQEKVWENRKTELPIIIPDATGNLPDFNFKEIFYDAKKMLYMELKRARGLISNYSDACPCVRFNFGTGFIPSVAGLNSEIFEDKMPWLTHHLTKEEIKNLTSESFKNLEKLGLLRKINSYLSVYKKFLPDEIKIFLPDTQGPFDIAHLLRGDEIFIDIYDDEDFFTHLMEISTYLYIEVSKLLKNKLSEPLNSGYHSGYVYLGNGGVRICEDTTTLISPKHLETVLKYTQKALKEFAGGFIHFCGKAEHLFEMLVEIPEVKGINFGNPGVYNFTDIFRKLNERGIVYIGNVPREENENWKDYLKRVYEMCEGKNLIFIFSKKEGEKKEEIFEYWKKLNL